MECLNQSKFEFKSINKGVSMSNFTNLSESDVRSINNLTRMNYSDLLNEYNDNGELELLLDENNRIMSYNEQGNATHYGISDESIPCNATVLKLTAHNPKHSIGYVAQIIRNIMDNARPKSTISVNDYENSAIMLMEIKEGKEIIEIDPSDMENVPLAYDWKLKAKLNTYNSYSAWQVKMKSPDLRFKNEHRKTLHFIKYLQACNDSKRAAGIINMIKFENIRLASNQRAIRKQYNITKINIAKPTYTYTDKDVISDVEGSF